MRISNIKNQNPRKRKIIFSKRHCFAVWLFWGVKESQTTAMNFKPLLAVRN